MAIMANKLPSTSLEQFLRQFNSSLIRLSKEKKPTLAHIFPYFRYKSRNKKAALGSTRLLINQVKAERFDRPFIHIE